MSVAMKLAYKRDVNDPLVTFCPETLLMRGDKGANIIELTVMDGSSPADLSGHTAVVMFQRPGDSDKIRCPGSISGNVISVTLLGDCYAYSGQYYASLVLDASGFTRTILRLAGHVENNGDGPVVDPTGTIPGYEDIARIYAELEASLKRSDAATDSANAAAQNANEKAAIADTAAGNANTAAGNANAGAGRANEAAGSIEGLTVEASDVAYNQPATAEVSDVEGHKHIAFGLRQGVPGAVPSITFTGETGEPNTDVVVTQSGPPEAPVVNLKIPQGVPGTGNVSTVDGVVSDSGGNVNLSAVRYVAQTLDDEQKVQARQNIGVDGQVYTCTAQALEDMSQEQQAELYTQGYRAIKTDNNSTVVLLGLASDGSLEWLGCNQPRRNLLDDSDFAIAQAGYGGKHGNSIYAADRWAGYSDWTYSVSDGVLSASATSGSSATITQYFIAPVSGPMTAAVNIMPADGASWSITVYDYTSGSVLLGNATGTADQLAVVNFSVTAGARIRFVIRGMTGEGVRSCTIAHPAVYQGSYTPKTLPPWESPNSSVELLNCKNCFRVIRNGSVFAAVGGASNTQATFFVPTEQKMRVNPSVSPSTGVSMSFRTQTGAYNDKDVTINSVTAVDGGLLFNVTGSNQIIPAAFANANVVLNTAISVSSDI